MIHMNYIIMKRNTHIRFIYMILGFLSAIFDIILCSFLIRQFITHNLSESHLLL